MPFEIIGEITGIETFATGSGIRELARLRKFYGRGRWRKRKGVARVRLPDGSYAIGRVALVRSPRNRTQGIQNQTLH